MDGSEHLPKSAFPQLTFSKISNLRKNDNVGIGKFGFGGSFNNIRFVLYHVRDSFH
jgi:hypothetical protein